MAIAFASTVGQGSNNGAAKATVVNVGYPTTPAPSAGDVLILAGGNTAPDPWTTPSTWTLLQQAAASASDVQGGAYIKAAAGGETGTLALGTATVATTVFGGMLRYTGASATPRGSANAIGAGAGTASPTPPTVAGVIGTDMVIRIYIYGDDTARAANTKTTLTVTNLTNASWNIRLNLSAAPSVASQFNGSIVIADKLGAADAPTISAAAIGGWNVITVVLSASAGAASSTGGFFPLMHHEPEGLWTPPKTRLSIDPASPRALTTGVR